MKAREQTGTHLGALIPGWVSEHLIEVLAWFLRVRRRDVPTSIKVDVL